MKSFLNGKTKVRAPAPASETTRAKPKRDCQYINWCCTVWPHCYASKEDCYDVCSQIGELSRYACFGIEHAPDTNVEHLQGFFILEKRARLAELKKVCEKVHFEPMKGTIQQNYEYCTKEDKGPLEFGTRPQFENNGEREKARWKTARDNASAGTWNEIDDQIYVCHLKNLKQIHAENCVSNQVMDECTGYWLYGVPHSGKSYDARVKYGKRDFYVKESLDHWFDGYGGEESIIIEDIDPDMVTPTTAQRLKVWCDVYPFPAQVKGGMLPAIRPKRIIVTSNYSIEECFPTASGAGLDALKRRFKVVHYPYPYNSGDRYEVPPTPGASVDEFVPTDSTTLQRSPNISGPGGKKVRVISPPPSSGSVVKPYTAAKRSKPVMPMVEESDEDEDSDDEESETEDEYDDDPEDYMSVDEEGSVVDLTYDSD